MTGSEHEGRSCNSDKGVCEAPAREIEDVSGNGDVAVKEVAVQ